MKKKRVVFVGYLASHYFNFGLDDLLNIAANSFGIVISLTVNHDPVRDALDIEDDRFKGARFKWRVVEDIEVFGKKRVLWSWSNG